MTDKASPRLLIVLQSASSLLTLKIKSQQNQTDAWQRKSASA